MSEAEPAGEGLALAALESILDYRFRDASLLEQALRHASYAHDVEDVDSNERLEFLGDAVVGLVVAHRLYLAHPEWAEGDLTRALHRLVDKRALAALALDLGLGDYLRLGRTERRSQGQAKASILADSMEAVIGAIYLDGGIESIDRLARRWFAASFAPGAPRVGRDPKTELQERVMESVGEFPTYVLVRDSDVEGDEERFEAQVEVQGEVWATGVGRTKRAAETAAAATAIERFEQPDD